MDHSILEISLFSDDLINTCRYMVRSCFLEVLQMINIEISNPNRPVLVKQMCNF